MAKQQFVDDLGATAATCLRLTESYQWSDRMVISWFGSVKSAMEPELRNDLYSIMLVKTASKAILKRFLLNQSFEEGNGTQHMQKLME